MKKSLSSTLRIGLALFMAMFSTNLLPAAVAYAAPQPNTSDSNKAEYWQNLGYGTCSKTDYSESSTATTYTMPAAASGSVWSLLVLKAANTDEVYANPSVGTTYNAPAKENGTLRTISHRITCTKPAPVVTPTNISAYEPDVTPVCGANNDIVTPASTAHVTYSNPAWVNNQKTVTATADQGYTLTGTVSWPLTDTVMGGCPTQPDAEVATSYEHRLTCEAGAETRIKTITTPYVFDENSAEWKLGTPGAPQYGEWTFERALTSAEKLRLECQQPEQPSPLVVVDVETNKTCGDGVMTRTKTVTTPYVFDVESWTWVLGTAGAPEYSDWTFDRALTAAEKEELGCETPCNHACGGGQDDKKVYVCKYVTKPGFGEILKQGKNPIEVSENATELEGWNGQTGWFFKDGQNSSYVLGYTDDFETAPTRDDCPGTEEPDVLASIVCTEEGANVTITVKNPYNHAMAYRVVIEGGDEDEYVIPANGTHEFEFSGYADGSYDFTVYEGNLALPALLNGVFDDIELPTPHYNWTKVFEHNFTVDCEEEQPPVVVDVCPNLPGNQTQVPTGYVKVGNECGQVQGNNDVCPNLPGSQTSIPTGSVKDSFGNCVIPAGTVLPVGGQGAGQILGTTLPTALPATGATSINPVATLIAAITTFLVVYGATKRRAEA